MKKILAALVTLVLVVACNSAPAPTPTPPAPVPPPPPPSAPYQPNPATVEATFDPAQSAEDRVVMPEGLKLEVTAQNGTLYTLHVPLNAVEGGQEVRMTVVSSLNKTPFDHILGAVRIEPEGMEFYTPPTLTIDAPAGTGEVLSGFAFEQEGQDFYLAPTDKPAQVQATAGRTTVKMELRRAKSYAAGFATWAKLSTWAKTHRPRDLSNSLFAESIVRRGKNMKEVYERAFDEYIDRYYNEPAPVALEPLLEAYAEWLRQVRQDGLEKELASRIALGKDLIRQKVEQLVMDIKDACTGPGGDAKAWAALRAFKFIRHLDNELFGMVKGLIPPIQGCLTFEIRFDSEMTLVDDSDHVLDGSKAKVSVSVVHAYDFNANLFQPPTQELKWDALSLTTQEGCSLVSHKTTPGSFVIVNYAPLWTLSPKGPATNLPRLKYMVGQAYVEWTIRCGDSGMVHNSGKFNGDEWEYPFRQAHQNEQKNGLYEPTLPTSIHTPAGVLIQYRYQRDLNLAGSRSAQEFSVISIIHRPK